MAEGSNSSRLAALALAAALTGLGGCAAAGGGSGSGAGGSHHQKVRESDLIAMLAVFPGRYDNNLQAEQDTRGGAHPGHDAVALTITHVFSPRLGHYVYYAQETAADDPRRVLSQTMYSFTVDEKRGIVETLYTFIEPLRWRDGQLNKDVFTSLEIEDLQAEGCQLLWKKKDQGYVATHDPKVCPDAGGASATQAEMSAGLLTMSGYKFRKST
jgi:hypothetical protein